MNVKPSFLFLIVLFQGASAIGQDQVINLLEEVVLSDISLTRDSRERRVQVLKDSVIQENDPSLGTLLKFNTPIYFRENGNGMVSSASFRGTSAQQTAVVWNGININSQFTGQTDFNTILTRNYDNISVRSGGGSVLYGSGAIGGSVHLNDHFDFDGKFHNFLQLEAGSFDTFSGTWKGGISSESTSLQVKLTHRSSANDFPYLGTDKTNENGDFDQMGLSTAIAHRLSEKHVLKFYSNYYQGNRGFSGTLFAPSKSGYEDRNSRNLLEWKAFLGDFTSTLKYAYLEEQFRYFENRERESFSYGKAGNHILKYDLNYVFASGLEITGIADLQQVRGEGTNIGKNNRNIGSLSLLIRQKLDKFSYGITTRKEITDNYRSPFLFSVNTAYGLLPQYSIRFSISRNFRIPTFNDLYWYAGGNQELEPEHALQLELGHDLQVKEFHLNLATFLINTRDLLRWLPGPSGLWRPENTGRVRNYGVEATLDWKRNFGNHQLSVNSSYAYTQSRNQATDKQLIYVPGHKATASVGYSLGEFSWYFQYLYTGRVFTSSDNQYALDPYQLSNIGLSYRLGSRRTWKIGVELHNLFNATYLSMPARPMPGRSFNSSISFKF